MAMRRRVSRIRRQHIQGRATDSRVVERDRGDTTVTSEREDTRPYEHLALGTRYDAAMRRGLILGATSASAATVAVLPAWGGDRLHRVGRNPEKRAGVVRGGGEPPQVTSQQAKF